MAFEQVVIKVVSHLYETVQYMEIYNTNHGDYCCILQLIQCPHVKCLMKKQDKKNSSPGQCLHLHKVPAVQRLISVWCHFVSFSLGPSGLVFETQSW